MTMKHAEPSSDLSAAADFERFYREAWPGAVRLAGLLSQDAGAAEDLAQEAFARMYPKWGRAENPSAYLPTTMVLLQDLPSPTTAGAARCRLLHPVVPRRTRLTALPTRAEPTQ
jgi:hypothetical protein